MNEPTPQNQDLSALDLASDLQIPQYREVPHQLLQMLNDETGLTQEEANWLSTYRQTPPDIQRLTNFLELIEMKRLAETGQNRITHANTKRDTDKERLSAIQTAEKTISQTIEETLKEPSPDPDQITLEIARRVRDVLMVEDAAVNHLNPESIQGKSWYQFFRDLRNMEKVTLEFLLKLIKEKLATPQNEDAAEQFIIARSKLKEATDTFGDFTGQTALSWTQDEIRICKAIFFELEPPANFDSREFVANLEMQTSRLRLAFVAVDQLKASLSQVPESNNILKRRKREKALETFQRELIKAHDYEYPYIPESLFDDAKQYKEGALTKSQLLKKLNDLGRLMTKIEELFEYLKNEERRSNLKDLIYRKNMEKADVIITKELEKQAKPAQDPRIQE